VVGFAVMANLVGAALVSAGGYHHHLAFNVWLGRDIKPRPPRTAGLREWTVLLASREEVAAVHGRVAAAGLAAEAHRGGFLVRDPWGTAVAFRQG
jgi:catechol 2,3-dioxygenase